MPGRSRSRSPRASGAGAEVVWAQYISPEGHPYYHQRETNQTVWQRPSGPNDRVVDGNAPIMPVAEVTWLRCCTAQGQFYYNQPQTGQTVWERPSGPSDRIMDHPAMPGQFGSMQASGFAGMFGAAGMPGGIPGGLPGMMPGGIMANAMMPGGIPGFFGAMPGGLAGHYAVSGTNVEAFIVKNSVDASAAAKLRALSPEQQRIVIDRGDLQDARNPNAVLMGRIRDAERSGGGDSTRSSAPLSITSAGGGSDNSVDQFCAENRIDASAGDRLKALPRDVQKSVMGRGNLTDARNPNAVLMGRIRDAERGL